MTDITCTHEDCYYSGWLRFMGEKQNICEYILIEGIPRGCDIANCSKYKPGKRNKKVYITYGKEFYKHVK